MATAIAKFSLMITGTGVGLYAFTEYRSKHIEERIVAFENRSVQAEKKKDVKRRMESRELFPPSEDD